MNPAAIDHCEFRARLEGERGVVLMILSMLIFAIIMVAALGLDFSQMSVSAQEATNYAKFAALSALQGYSTAPAGSTKSQKLERALQAANDVGSLNLVLNVGGQQHADSLADDGSQSHPKLVAGKYYSEVPSGTSSCANPCQTGEEVPCFVPLTDVQIGCEPAGTTEVLPNAFRVQGTYFSNVKTILAQVFTSGTYNVNVDEVAAFTPRRGVMMVDISDTMFRETHNPDTSDPHVALFEYYLTADNGSTPYSGFDTKWAALQDNRSSPTQTPPSNTDPEYSKVHYKSDYVQVTPLRDSQYGDDPDYAKYHPDPSASDATINYSADPIGGIYRIDKYRDAYYKGPEPFMTVFRGLNSAVAAFKERAVTGDKLGLIFFDKTVTWPRVINLTSDFDYIQRFTDASIEGDPERGMDLLLKHGIFPANDNKSNLMLAINEAMRQFNNTQAQTVPSVDFMVYFGDGLANCAEHLPPAIAVDGPCGDDYDRYSQAVKEIKDYAIQNLYPRRIPLNIILIGDHVRPHTLAMSDGSGGCMTDTQARNAEMPYVRGDSYSTPAEWRNAYWNMSSEHPFYQANADMYQLTRITGGIWGPLRMTTTDSSLCNTTCSGSDPATAARSEYSCNTTTHDIEDYIASIMGSNPFMIVPHSS
jgi:hypothetical protein